MASLLRSLRAFGRRAPSPPRAFTNPNFERITAEKVEEETFPDYLAIRYYPVRIGEVLASRYQGVGKLGYGAFSTVWLARDLIQHRYIALKVFIRSEAIGKTADHELSTYQHMASVISASKHPGRAAIRTLLDSFIVTGPDREHQCLVHMPLWDSVKAFLARNPECRVIHTDLKMDNIMFGVQDDSVFDDFERAELETPSPRKEVDGQFIYASRGLNIPRTLGLPLLCDFGSAVPTDNGNVKDVQPDLYRAPEVILGVPWTSKIDIWNAGCMIWDMFEGRHMFSGRDPEYGTYRSRAHIASIISILGLPPPELVLHGRHSSKFFCQGKFHAGIDLPPASSLEETETSLQGTERQLFLQFMGKMMRWLPEQRCTAGQLLSGPWLNHTQSDT